MFLNGSLLCKTISDKTQLADIFSNKCSSQMLLVVKQDVPRFRDLDRNIKSFYILNLKESKIVLWKEQ